MAEDRFVKIGHLKSTVELRAQLDELGIDLPCDPAILPAEQSPMASPLHIPRGAGQRIVGNRWCIHPMEGWDGTTDGQPTETVLRRWEHFGRSGAKLIWGGEAFAVQADGRANPNQLGIVDENLPRAEAGLRAILQRLTDAHQQEFGRTDDLLVGLQLTHSGRYCRPIDKKQLQPRIAYHHPILDARVNVSPADDSCIITDDYLQKLIANYIRAAKLAHQAGFSFVDVKHCHGYLGHELLSGFTRPGRYGGSFENRTRFARQIICGIHAECPNLMVGVRLSAFDHPPFKPDPSSAVPGRLGTGIPEDFRRFMPYRFGFGCNPDNPMQMDLAEPIEFIRMLSGLGVRLINVSCCSPYYNPHFQRPAAFPPSDGYQPPEDPLVGVARQIDATRQIKAACPDSILVGSGYSYLQEFLPHVAQAVVRNGWVDSVGVGRLVLSYWDLPADTLAGKPLAAKRLCRTFSDCTTAPRNGIISGCFPLDPYYKELPQHAELKTRKNEIRKSLTVIQPSAEKPPGARS